MSTTSAPEASTGSRAAKPDNLMSDLRSEFGTDGKDTARKLAGAGGAASKVLDADPWSKSINVAQKAASRKAGDLAENVGGKTGKTITQDATKIAAETAKGASKGAAAGGIGAAPGVIAGAAKGAAQTKTGRIAVIVVLVPFILYFAFISLLPLLFLIVLTSGGEQQEDTGVISEVDDFLFGEDDE